jgi:hypothetical protein
MGLCSHHSGIQQSHNELSTVQAFYCFDFSLRGGGSRDFT